MKPKIKKVLIFFYLMIPEYLRNYFENFIDELRLKANKRLQPNHKFSEVFALNTRGIFICCDLRNKIQISSSKNINFQINSNFEKIYVCSDALERFVKIRLKHIQHPFKLYSGDSDLCINSTFLDKRIISEILENPYLKTWHAQNLDYHHPKLKNLPIGIDYHTDYCLKGISPAAQEKKLKEILLTAKNTFQREVVAYCNWHFHLNRGDRNECFKTTSRELCFYEPNRVSRIDSWANQSKFAFCLSPEGAGYDCHRTYEAIFLGSIPIVKNNCLSRMYAKLPIIIVDNYGQISKDFLNYELEKISKKRFDFTNIVMTSCAGKNNKNLQNLTFNEFQEIFLNS